MTFSHYYTQVKEILGIESLTEKSARALMRLYLARASVEDAAKKIKENSLQKHFTEGKM